MKTLWIAACAFAFTAVNGYASDSDFETLENVRLKPMYCANTNPADQPIFFILKKGKKTDWAMHNRQGRVWLVVPFSMDDVFRTVNDYPSFYKKAKAKYWQSNGILTTEHVEFRSDQGVSGYRIDEEFLFTPNMDTAQNTSQVYTLSGAPGIKTKRTFACQDLTPELDTTEDY